MTPSNETLKEIGVNRIVGVRSYGRWSVTLFAGPQAGHGQDSDLEKATQKALEDLKKGRA